MGGQSLKKFTRFDKLVVNILKLKKGQGRMLMNRFSLVGFTLTSYTITFTQ